MHKPEERQSVRNRWRRKRGKRGGMEIQKRDFIKENSRMKQGLLVLAFSIAFDQTLMGVLVTLCLGYGLYLARRQRNLPRLALWPKGLRYLLMGLWALGYLSLHNPLVQHAGVCTFNFIYVTGQYVALIWLLSRFGGSFVPPRIFSLLPDGSGKGTDKGCGGEAVVGFSGEKSEPVSSADERGEASDSGGSGCGGGMLSRWCTAFRRQPFPVQLLLVLGGASCIVVVLGILQHFFGTVTDGAWIDRNANPLLKVRVYSSWENPNILAGYLCLVASYVMGFISVTENRRQRWGFFGFLLLTLLCLVFTFSRGFWIAMTAQLLLFVAVFYHRGIWYLLGTGLVGGLLAGPAIWQRLATLRDVMEDSSAAMRLGYLEIARAIIADHPFGIGWYNYRYIFPEYDYYFKNPDVIMYHCHNLILNITAELGVQGALLFVLAWLFFLRMAWELHRRGRFSWIRGYGRGYLIMSLGMLVGSMGDHVFFNVRMGMLFWTASTLLLLCRQYQSYGKAVDSSVPAGTERG